MLRLGRFVCTLFRRSFVHPQVVDAADCCPPAGALLFCDFPRQMWGDARHGARHALGMDDFITDDQLFLDALDAIVTDALARIGDDPRARFQFFR